MSISRRRFVGTLMAGAVLKNASVSSALAAEITPWHKEIAAQAKALDKKIPLNLLVPEGSASNVKAATDEFTRLSGVTCTIREIAIDKINVELVLQVGVETIDVALPATFGLIDLAQAQVILPLDTYANQYEPENFSDDHLYRKGDYYHGKLYGYQTDGDAYLLFYNKTMMQDPAEIKAYAAATGKALEPAKSWEDLDSMMEFFHRPEQNQYGGSLFRSPGYLVWEWWARFHAKGYLPFDENMHVNVNNSAGVDALNELIAATAFLTPNAESNDVFENWAEFGRGNVFCNIGWGGTQKTLRANSGMNDTLLHSALPGPVINGAPSSMGYFNWGWNYTVCANSSQPELAYLLTLFCTSPEASTLAIRKEDGFFDPFRECHYVDDTIREVYGDNYLEAHRNSMLNSIPDLYIKGQSNYLDVLRQQIMLALHENLSAKDALDICAQKWGHITRRLGRRQQQKEWMTLVESYPSYMQDALYRR